MNINIPPDSRDWLFADHAPEVRTGHRRPRDRQCQGKVPHRNERAARAALRGTIEQTGDMTLQYYQCPHCGRFHVGHPDKTQRRNLYLRRILTLIDKAVKS